MMEKIMNNKQAIGQPMKATQAKRGESLQADSTKETKETKESKDSAFQAQLTQAGIAQNQLQPQPLPEPKVTQQEAVEPKGEEKGAQMQAVKPMPLATAMALASVEQGAPAPWDPNQKSSNTMPTLKTAASLNTGSAMTGLKPESEGIPQSVGASPALSTEVTQALPAAQGASVKKEALRPTRGDADAALDSKLEAALNMLMASPLKGVPQQKPGPASVDGAEVQLMQDMKMSGTDGATAGNALEAQMASMGGVIQGSTQAKLQDKKPQSNALNSALSGGEFLTTLSAVKGGAVNQSQTDAGDLSQQSGEFGGNGKGANGKLDAKANLRIVDGGAKLKKSQFADTLDMTRTDQLSTQSSLSNLAAGSATATEVTGHVTSGANAEDRLSSESLTNVSNTIRNLTPQGGGEMRIKLRPENLGELHIRVVTDGRNVTLHVQAQDERAKKIIEESIGHLKDSMASQSLSLGAVDFSVAQAKNSASMDQQRNDQGQAGNHGQGMFQDMLGQNSNQQSGRGAWNGVENNESGPRVRGMNAGNAAMSSRMVADAARSAVASGNGRLDVRA